MEAGDDLRGARPHDGRRGRRPALRQAQGHLLTTAVVAGGVGAARFLRGLCAAVDPLSVTAIVNVGDDEVFWGLAISPDLDTVVYTCAEAIDPERGWGLRDETWRALEAARALAVANQRGDLGWFALGDRDLGTHLYRTARLQEGAPLSTVTAELARAFGLRMRVLPATDDPLRTRVITAAGELAFQEYFVREQHAVAVSGVRVAGVEAATPAPGVLEALEEADAVVVAPSNPVVSIEPVLSVPGVRAAVAARRECAVAVSPIVGGRALKGPADRLLRELGQEPSVVGVARLYASLVATLVVDEVDAELAPAVEAEGMRCVVARTVMVDTDAAAELARTCLAAAR